MTKTLEERFKEEDKKTWRTCTPNNYFSIDTILRIVENWLTEKREDLFINTVTTMDCEMSGVREDTFEALLASLHFQSSKEVKANENI
jgi:hypothetical protein